MFGGGSPTECWRKLEPEARIIFRRLTARLKVTGPWAVVLPNARLNYGEESVGRACMKRKPGTLEFSLTESYCLYSSDGENLYRAAFITAPGRCNVTIIIIEFFYDRIARVSSPEGDPLLHYARPWRWHLAFGGAGVIH